MRTRLDDPGLLSRDLGNGTAQKVGVIKIDWRNHRNIGIGHIGGVPGSAQADLDVGPVGAEELADAEERPGCQRPPPREHDPELVGAAGEQRRHPERERDRQPHVPEVERRVVGDHVGVLQARVEPDSVRRRRLRRERARDGDEEQREEADHQPEDGHRPGDPDALDARHADRAGKPRYDANPVSGAASASRSF